MIIKQVLRPERLRRVPTQFSWVDQRVARADTELEPEPLLCSVRAFRYFRQYRTIKRAANT